VASILDRCDGQQTIVLNGSTEATTLDTHTTLTREVERSPCWREMLCRKDANLIYLK
jgi:hypothetical protein